MFAYVTIFHKWARMKVHDDETLNWYHCYALINSSSVTTDDFWFEKEMIRHCVIVNNSCQKELSVVEVQLCDTYNENNPHICVSWPLIEWIQQKKNNIAHLIHFSSQQNPSDVESALLLVLSFFYFSPSRDFLFTQIVFYSVL